MTGFDQHRGGILDGFGRLQRSGMAAKIEAAIGLIVPSLKQNRPLLECGNGGTVADALHISGELVAGFLVERKALNVICLSANVSVMTAWANDCDYDGVFERQVEAHGGGAGCCFASRRAGTRGTSSGP